MAEPLRPQLGEHAERLIADVMDKREEAIINAVRVKLPHVSPQDALTAWVQLDEARKLRSALIKRADLEKTQHAAMR